MTQYIDLGRDQQGNCIYAPKFPDIAYSARMASGQNSSITIPSTSNSWTMIFSYSGNQDFWVSVNNTAAPPAGATFSSTNSILNPAQLTVNSSDTVNIYNNGILQDIGVCLYANS